MKVNRKTEEVYEKPMSNWSTKDSDKYWHRITIELYDNELTIHKKLYFRYGHGDHEGVDKINRDSDNSVVYKTRNLENITTDLENRMIEFLLNMFKKKSDNIKTDISNMQEELLKKEEEIRLLSNHSREIKLKRIVK